MIAAEHDRREVMQALLDRSADANAATYGSDTTALMIATEDNRREVVQLLLDRGANANATRGRDGMTVLMIAAKNDRREVVRALLDRGADPNARRRNDGATVLIIAAENGHSEVAETLLDRGADITAGRTYDGATAVMVATENGHREVAQTLARRCAMSLMNRAEGDLIDLYRMGIVVIEGSGQSITDITVKVTNRAWFAVRVSVSHGTYFVSGGRHQNMVARQRHEFELPAGGSKQISVPASCINASLPIPGEADHFNGVARVDDRVRRFLEAAESEDAMVIQAGVWAVTDGYSRERIRNGLFNRRVRIIHERYGGARREENATPAISNAQISRAKSILDNLGIPNSI